MRPEFEPVDLFAVVLALAVIIGCVNQLCIKLPPAIAMLLGSLIVSFAIVASDRLFHLHVMSWFRDTLDAASLPRLFLNAVLALLLFAGSLHVDVAELRQLRWTILLLATAGVMISTSIFGMGMWLAFGLSGLAVPRAWCFVLGAILAPTDAVVVETLLQKVSLPPRLRAAIVGESLFNDGAGVVLFLIALGVTQGETLVIGHGDIALALLREIGGGALLGLALGWLAALLMRLVSDRGLQLLISLTLVLGTYRLANIFELSGPIAVVSAGLCLGSPSPRFGMTADTRTALVGFWSLLDQLMNTLLFFAIGLQIMSLVVGSIELAPIAFGIPLAILSRMISVAASFLVVRGTPRAKAREIAVLTWAGLRGGVSIALALTLPPSPWRVELLVVTYGVVVFTIVVQGLTIVPYLRSVYAADKPT